MSKQSILVVDDDKSIRDYLSAFLTSCGFHVDCLDLEMRRLIVWHPVIHLP